MSKVKTYLIIFTGPLIRSWSGWALNVIWRRLSDLHAVSFINKYMFVFRWLHFFNFSFSFAGWLLLQVLLTSSWEGTRTFLPRWTIDLITCDSPSNSRIWLMQSMETKELILRWFSAKDLAAWIASMLGIGKSAPTLLMDHGPISTTQVKPFQVTTTEYMCIFSANFA